MGTMASQITSVTIVYSNFYWGADQRKHQSSASLAFVRGIHQWPVNSQHKWPVLRKMFPFDDVIMRGVKILGCGTHGRYYWDMLQQRLNVHDSLGKSCMWWIPTRNTLCSIMLLACLIKVSLVGWIDSLTLCYSMLTHLPLDKLDAISQTILSYAFSWMKSFVFWLKFHWIFSLRFQLTITHHWIR